MNIHFLLWSGTTGRLTGQKSLCVILRDQENKQFLLVNRLVVTGLTAFSRSLCVKRLCDFFLPENLVSSAKKKLGEFA